MPIKFLNTVAVDTSVLYVDTINDRVGIGTTSPGDKLHVEGNIYLGASSRTIYTGGSGNLTFQNNTGNILFLRSNGSSESMRIDASGNVGIGTTSPSHKLDVDGYIAADRYVDTDNASFYLEPGSGTTGQWKLQTPSGYVSIGPNNTSWTHFYTDRPNGYYFDKRLVVDSGTFASYNEDLTLQAPYNTTRMVIDSSTGNVGIGTTSPSEKLEVVGNAILDASNANLKIKAGITGTKGDIQWTFNTDSTVYASAGIAYDNRTTDGFLIDSGYPITLDYASGYIRFLNNGSEKMRINTSGNVGIGTTSPGVKLDVDGDVRVSLFSKFTFANGQYIKDDGSAGLDIASISAAGTINFITNSTDKMVITPAGQVQFNNYGSGTFTGTATKNLAVDSSGNVIETDGGVVDGSGTTNYVSKWSDSNTLTDSVIYDNGTNIGIGTATPSTLLQLSSNNPVLTLTDTESTYRYAGLALTTNGGSWNLSNGDSTTAANSNLYITRNSDGTDNRFIFHRDSYYFGVYDNTNTIKTVIRANGDSYFNGGNVGIGTTSPDTKLHVEGNLLVDAYNQGEDNGIFLREGFLTIDQPSITVWDMSNSGASPDGLSINAHDGIRFRENGGEVARFKDGNFGIGTTSPAYKLDISGSLRVTSESTFTSNLLFPDNARIKFGNNQDFNLYRSSTDSYISSSDGDILIDNHADDKDIILRSDDGSGGLTEYLRLDGSTTNAYFLNPGNVGIGTTSPATNLEIKSTGNTIVRLSTDGDAADQQILQFYRNSGAYAQIDYDPGGGNSSGLSLTDFRDDINSHILFNTRGTNERMRIESDGNVGIGTTSPGVKLQVGDGTNDDAVRSYMNDGSYTEMRGYGLQFSRAASYMRPTADNTKTLYLGSNVAQWNTLSIDASTTTFNTNGSENMRINSSGNVGIGTTSPSNGKLEIQSSTNQISVNTGTAGDGRLHIGHFSNGTFIGTYGDDGGAADLIRFGTHSGDERMRINSAGNVGIGTTSPSSKLHVRKAAGPLSSFNSNTIGIFETNGPGYVNIVTGTTSTGELWFSDSSEGRGRVRYNHSDDSLQFWTANGEKLRVGINGQIGIGGTNYGSSGDVLTSNGSGSAPSWQPASGGGGGNEFASGLYIGGTAAANLLEDYEKGTFTPTVTRSYTGGYPSPGTNYGYYERVGEWVTVGFNLQFRGGISSSTTFTLTNITNLPFTALNVSGNTANGATIYNYVTNNNESSNTNDYGARISNNSTTTSFYEGNSSTQVFTVAAMQSRYVTGVVKYRVFA